MLDAVIAAPDVAEEALAGLTAEPKTLPPKLFYDAAGVRLFDRITRLPEYYLTRTERALLGRVAAEIAGLAPQGAALVEYGASDEGKAALLLDAAPGRFAAYVPIDVAAGALAAMQSRMARCRPLLAVHPLCADFQHPLVLPDGAARAAFGFFPGSTIGNLDPAAAHRFLREAARTLGPRAWLIVGADPCQDRSRLLPAYNDAQGVTAAFNLNLLHRLNREAGADFAIGEFAHRAIWNDAESRIEMHLVSQRAQTVRLAGMTLRFARGETIHTENSYKYPAASFRMLAAESGWRVARQWMDPAGNFAIYALSAG